MCTHSLGDLQVKNDAKYIYHINVVYYRDKGHYLLNPITIHFSAELNSLILKLDERYTANLEQCSHYYTKQRKEGLLNLWSMAPDLEHLTGQ